MNEADQLSAINQQIENNKIPQPVTVRTFLSWFKAQRRGWNVVQQINAQLSNFQLATEPHFEYEYIDSEIRFVRKRNSDVTETSSVPIPINNSPTISTVIAGSTDNYQSYADPTYRIGKLEAANRQLVYVSPDSDLSEAVTKTLLHDLSQLPVMQQPKRGLKGVISWRSIGINLSAGKSLTKVRELMGVDYQLISSDTSLFKAIPTIIEHDYVLIENSSKEISGIVTASDLSLQFQQLSEPFLLVSEIENHIRNILHKLPEEEIKKAKDDKDNTRVVNSVSDLTFGEYLRLFQNLSIWSALKLHIDRKTFCDHLEKTKDIRNNIMHFDPDGLDQESIDTLRQIARLLQTLEKIKAA